MKSRVSLTVDNELLDAAEAYAAQKHISLSELFEDYLRTLSRLPIGKNFVEVVEKLKPKFDVRGDLKDQYYKGRSGKCGF